MVKIAVTGWSGRLGSELVNRGCEPFSCDITNSNQIFSELLRIKPDVIIHCAAITDVDACERLDVYKRATEVSWGGTTRLRKLFSGKIIYISTDYVFDGLSGPYGEKAEPSPRCNYGIVKHLGEQVILGANSPGDVIVRTTILYGSNAKPDFVTKVLEKFDAEEPFGIPYNIYGNPTYIPHLVDALLKLIEIENPPKIVNIVGEDWISRYEFAVTIANIFDKDKDLVYGVREKVGDALRPNKAGLKVGLAKRLGLPIHNYIDGLLEMRKKYADYR